MNELKVEKKEYRAELAAMQERLLEIGEALGEEIEIGVSRMMDGEWESNTRIRRAR